MKQLNTEARKQLSIFPTDQLQLPGVVPSEKKKKPLCVSPRTRKKQQITAMIQNTEHEINKASKDRGTSQRSLHKNGDYSGGVRRVQKKKICRKKVQER
jgi:hypothetical protein